MSSPSNELAFTPIERMVRAASRRRQNEQMVSAEEVARKLVRLQMRIRELEAEVTALQAVPAGWR
jgi:hypothetical protein